MNRYLGARKEIVSDSIDVCFECTESKHQGAMKVRIFGLIFRGILGFLKKPLRLFEKTICKVVYVGHSPAPSFYHFKLRSLCVVLLNGNIDI